MIIYFAHSMRDYQTECAMVCRQAIKATNPGAVLLDPEDLNWNALVEEKGGHEAVYRYVVGQVDAVDVLEHQGHVGRGVFTEVQLALAAQKPVNVWRDGRRLPVLGVEYVQRNDWKVRYGRLVVAGAGIDAEAFTL